MKPVAIFRHTNKEGPGHITRFLDKREIPWEVLQSMPAMPSRGMHLLIQGWFSWAGR
jgi:hypothetical protein